MPCICSRKLKGKKRDISKEERFLTLSTFGNVYHCMIGSIILLTGLGLVIHTLLDCISTSPATKDCTHRSEETH